MFFEIDPHLNNQFRYIKISKAFDDDTYVIINKLFPDIDLIDRKLMTFSNKNRYDLNLQHSLQFCTDENMLKLINYMTSLEFFHKLCKYFEIDSSSYKTISRRHENKLSDVIVDFQFAFNVPYTLKSKSFLRPPHIDTPDKLFVILLYFPYIDSTYNDKTDFGNLILYRNSTTNTFMNSAFLDVEQFDEIQYQHNTGIVFLNTNDAIHAPLSLVNHPNEHRRFINIVFMKSYGTC